MSSFKIIIKQMMIQDQLFSCLNPKNQHSLTSIYVKFSKHVEFGKAVYLIGNHESLGKWQVSKALKLKGGENGVWRGTFQFEKTKKNEILQYKYLIADYIYHQKNELIWENGSNRILDFQHVSQSQIFLNQIWDHQKIIFEVTTASEQNIEQVQIFGNCIQLGLWLSPIVLSRSFCAFAQEQQKWRVQIKIEKYRSMVQYYYVYKMKNGKMKSRQFKKTLSQLEVTKGDMQKSSQFQYQAGYILIRDYQNINSSTTLQLIKKRQSHRKKKCFQGIRPFQQDPNSKIATQNMLAV